MSFRGWQSYLIGSGLTKYVRKGIIVVVVCLFLFFFLTEILV